VRIEQLTTPSNIDVTDEWIYTTTPPYQSCTNYPKIKEPSKNYNVRVVTKSKFHTEGPQLLGSSGRNSVITASPLPVICSPLL
jgi:hypothetical protein